MIYKHTQVGTLILVVLGIVAIWTMVTWWLSRQPIWIFVIILSGVLLVGILFGSLTVTVDDSSVQCWFGPGWFRRQFALAEIAEVVPVKNPWFYGWGIRYTGNGWLFNVSGFDAVEITFTSGKQVRIGTDQPQKLAAAIREGAG